MPRRAITLLLAGIFLITSGQAAPAFSFPDLSKEQNNSLNQDIMALRVPAEIGKMQEVFVSEELRVKREELAKKRNDFSPFTFHSPLVILIQDAHAVPEAQRNIQKLIRFFQEHLGIAQVFVEGTGSLFDPKIFKSFPDQDLLHTTLNSYFERGELTGPVAAAILNKMPAVYRGIEKKELYLRGLQLFREAMEQEENLMTRLQAEGRKLQAKKEKVYSKELLKVDQLIRDFQSEKKNILEVIQQLEKGAEHKALSVPPSIKTLIKEVKNDSRVSAEVDGEIRRLADEIKNKIGFRDKGQGTREHEILDPGDLTPDPLIQFNAKYQSYLTQQISAGEFGAYLRELIERGARDSGLGDSNDFSNPQHPTAIPVFSTKLSELVEHRYRMNDLEGTQLFKDFEIYAETVKKSLFENEEQRQLDRKSRELYLLEKLAKLELTREEWDVVRRASLAHHVTKSAENHPEQGYGVAASKELEKEASSKEPENSVSEPLTLDPLFSSHFAFYKNADKRDEAFHKNLLNLMHRKHISGPLTPDPQSVILIAGGFHTQGLIQKFKEAKISYVLIRPNVGVAPEETNYRAHMTGDVSWKNYYQIRNGQVNVYEAFVRAVRDRLISEMLDVKGEKSKNDSQFTIHASQILKEWRDQLLMDLAKENDLARAGEYTFLLDEARGDRELPPQNFSREKWLLNINSFVKKWAVFKSQESQGQVNRQDILKLWQASAILDQTGNVLVNDWIPAQVIIRSEIRTSASKPNQVRELTQYLGELQHDLVNETLASERRESKALAIGRRSFHQVRGLFQKAAVNPALLTQENADDLFSLALTEIDALKTVLQAIAHDEYFSVRQIAAQSLAPITFSLGTIILNLDDILMDHPDRNIKRRTAEAMYKMKHQLQDPLEELHRVLFSPLLSGRVFQNYFYANLHGYHQLSSILQDVFSARSELRQPPRQMKMELDPGGELAPYLIRIIAKDDPLRKRTDIQVSIYEKRYGSRISKDVEMIVYHQFETVVIVNFFPRFPERSERNYVPGRGRALLREILKRYPGYAVLADASPAFQKSFEKLEEYGYQPMTLNQNEEVFEKLVRQKMEEYNNDPVIRDAWHGATLFGTVSAQGNAGARSEQRQNPEEFYYVWPEDHHEPMVRIQGAYGQDALILGFVRMENESVEARKYLARMARYFIQAAKERYPNNPFPLEIRNITNPHSLHFVRRLFEDETILVSPSGKSDWKPVDGSIASLYQEFGPLLIEEEGIYKGKQIEVKWQNGQMHVEAPEGVSVRFRQYYMVVRDEKTGQILRHVHFARALDIRGSLNLSGNARSEVRNLIENYRQMLIDHLSGTIPGSRDRLNQARGDLARALAKFLREQKESVLTQDASFWEMAVRKLIEDQGEKKRNFNFRAETQKLQEVVRLWLNQAQFNEDEPAIPFHTLLSYKPPAVEPPKNLILPRSEVRSEEGTVSALKLVDLVSGRDKALIYKVPVVSEGKSQPDEGWKAFHEMVFDFPKFLEAEAAKGTKIPIVLVVPDEIENIGPLDEKAPWIEGSRVAMAWASAFYRFPDLGKGMEVRILRVPHAQITDEPAIQDAIRALVDLKISDQSHETPEERMVKRIFRMEDLEKKITVSRIPPSATFVPHALLKIQIPSRVMEVQSVKPEKLSPQKPGQQRIVITGGAGFIGSNLVRRLLREGHQVIVLDSLASGRRSNLSEIEQDPNFYYQQVNISQRFEVEGPVDAVMHLASLASPEFYYKDPFGTLMAGLMGTKITLDLAQGKNARYLFSSTSEIYGDPDLSDPRAYPQQESYPGRVSPVLKRSQYDQSKRGAETLVKLYVEKLGLDARWVRIFNTYGPYMRLDDGRVIPNFISSLLRKEPMKLYGGGQQTRSFAYAEDTVDGILKLLNSDKISKHTPVTQRVFNIGNPSEFTVHELAEKVNQLGNEYLGYSVPIEEIEQPDASDPKIRKPDILRAKTVLDFEPKITLDEGLRATFEHLKKEGLLEQAVQRSELRAVPRINREALLKQIRSSLSWDQIRKIKSGEVVARNQEGQLNVFYVGSLWAIFKTRLETIEEIFKPYLGGKNLSEEIAFRARRLAPGQKLTVVDWGAGNGQALKDLRMALDAKQIPREKVRLVGFADTYDEAWLSLIPYDIEWIFDIGEHFSNYFQKQEIDFLFSFAGLLHHQAPETYVSYITQQIHPLLSPDGKIIHSVPVRRVNLAELGPELNPVFDLNKDYDPEFQISHLIYTHVLSLTPKPERGNPRSEVRNGNDANEKDEEEEGLEEILKADLLAPDQRQNRDLSDWFESPSARVNLSDGALKSHPLDKRLQSLYDLATDTEDAYQDLQRVRQQDPLRPGLLKLISILLRNVLKIEAAFTELQNQPGFQGSWWHRSVYFRDIQGFVTKAPSLQEELIRLQNDLQKNRSEIRQSLRLIALSFRPGRESLWAPELERAFTVVRWMRPQDLAQKLRHQVDGILGTEDPYSAEFWSARKQVVDELTQSLMRVLDQPQLKNRKWTLGLDLADSNNKTVLKRLQTDYQKIFQGILNGKVERVIFSGQANTVFLQTLKKNGIVYGGVRNISRFQMPSIHQAVLPLISPDERKENFLNEIVVPIGLRYGNLSRESLEQDTLFLARLVQLVYGLLIADMVSSPSDLKNPQSSGMKSLLKAMSLWKQYAETVGTGSLVSRYENGFLVNVTTLEMMIQWRASELVARAA